MLNGMRSFSLKIRQVSDNIYSYIAYGHLKIAGPEFEQQVISGSILIIYYRRCYRIILVCTFEPSIRISW
jgi:hypothetical protein